MASRVLAAVLVVLVCGCRSVHADVVPLTEATYADKVKEKDTLWFVEFYTPWCGYCKRLAPVWSDLGKALEGEEGVEVGSVDCTTSKSVCSKADIRAYPTLKLFYNGEEYKQYAGPRDLDSLKNFAIEAAAELAQAAGHREAATQ